MNLLIFFGFCGQCLIGVYSFPLFNKPSKFMNFENRHRHPMIAGKADKNDVITYLRKYGYLPTDSKYGYHTNLESIQFRRALHIFQQFSGLKPTGELDEETSEVIKKPRCGVKDIDPIREGKTSLKFKIKKRRMKRFSVQGTKLQTNRNDIKYSIDQFSSKLTKSYVTETLQQAFKVWSKHIPLRFDKVEDDKPSDVKVVFATAAHGDGQPFDGAGRDLAHAFYPEKGSDVHFDDDEPWGPQGRNLLWVAAHEIGHSLGLKHSSDKSSLMHATYGGFGKTIDDVALTSDDIAGIQSLYGQAKLETESKKVGTKKTVPVIQQKKFHGISKKYQPKVQANKPRMPMNKPRVPMNKPIVPMNKPRVPMNKPRLPMNEPRGPMNKPKVPSNKPSIPINPRKIRTKAQEKDHSQKEESLDICRDVTIDAMLVLENGTVYAFKGSNYWRVNVDGGSVEPDFPRPIKQDWKNMPDNLDAALQEPFTAVIKGHQGSLLEEGDNGDIVAEPMRSLEKLGAFGHLPQPIDAALSEGGYDGSFWFFKGTKYWRDMNWDGLPEEDSRTKKPDYLNLKEVHPILRNRGVNAAVNIPTGPRKGMYLFVGSQYLKVYKFRGRLMTFESPGQTGRDWFGCM